MRHLRWIFMGLLAGPVLGQVLADKPQQPSLEMLEYLGSLVESDEGLIGPEDFEESDEDAKQRKQSKQSGKEEENDE